MEKRHLVVGLIGNFTKVRVTCWVNIKCEPDAALMISKVLPHLVTILLALIHERDIKQIVHEFLINMAIRVGFRRGKIPVQSMIFAKEAELAIGKTLVE